MNTSITKGTRVAFDSDYGPQKGIVIGVQRSITNGQSFAVIEVDHALPGCTWSVPLNDLQVKAAA